MSSEDVKLLLQVVTPEKIVIEEKDIDIVVFRTEGKEDKS